MSIGTPVDIGSVMPAGATTSSTQTLTTTHAVAAGDSIIVAIGNDVLGRVLNSVTDSAGNTYSIDVVKSHSTLAVDVYMASCHNATALPSGGTITATFATSVSGRIGIAAITDSGLAHSSTLDKTASQQQSTGNAWSSTATAATTQADELVVGASYILTATSSTADAGLTEIEDGAAGARSLTVVYKIVSATGAQTASGSWANSAAHVSVVATYKAAVGQTIAVGQATETDTSQPVAKLKTRAAAQSTETDAAQALAKLKTRALAQAVESDTAQAVAKVKTRTAAQATETDVAHPLTATKSATLGEPVEADTAQPVAKIKARALAQATSTETAGIVVPAKSGTVARATESDSASQITPPNATPVGRASETDTAGPIVARKSLVVGRAASFEVALTLTGAKGLAVNQTSEIDSAGLLTPIVALPADSYTDAVVGILTVAPTTGIFTSPANRN